MYENNENNEIKTSQDLIDFWNENNFQNKTKIHKEDYKYLQEQDYLINCKNSMDYIEKYFYKNPPKDGCFHSNLCPFPYLGDIKKAKIFILNLNPCLGSDYFDEEDEEYKKEIENSLKQKLEKYPLFSLNPKYFWTDGNKYWMKKFNKIIEKAQEVQKETKAKILEKLSQNIALLEIVPYHSKSFDFRNYKKLESVKKMFDFINNYVIMRVKNKECILIITRKWNEIKDEIKDEEFQKHIKENNKKLLEEKGLFFYTGGECRNPSFGVDSSAGKIILKKIFGIDFK